MMATLAMLQSCVDEGGVEFPDEEENPVVITESISLISYLNFIQKHSIKPSELCFQPVYPLELGFSNGINITVSNESGLLEALQSQTSGFYVSGTELPFVAEKGGVLHFIENEDQFAELLMDCDLPTLRQSLEETYAQCYEFKYPFEMVLPNDDTVTVDNVETLVAIGNSTNVRFQPRFVYPVSVEIFEENVVRDIKNEFELYHVINDCDGCPDLKFYIEEEWNYLFYFEAKDELLTDHDGFAWYIDGVQKEIDGPAVDGDNQYVARLAPGFYEICMKSENRDCVLGVEYCEELEVKDGDCPYMFFSYSKVGDRGYVFESDFPKMNQIEYWWVVRKHGIDEPIWIEPDSQNFFDFGFEEPGVYTVCIEFEGTSCQFISYCVEFQFD